MACKYCGCGCNHCTSFVKTTKIDVGKSALTLTIPERELSNKQLVCVCLAQCVDEIPEPLKVVLKVGSKEYYIINTSVPCYCGAPTCLYSDQLATCRCTKNVRPRQIINLRFASDTNLFRYVGPAKALYPTQFKFPIIEPNKPGFWEPFNVKGTAEEKEDKEG